MNLTLETGVSVITVFLQGLISFFSPCVLPLIPLYIGYLSGGAKTVDEEGNIFYKKNKVMLNTLFFVFGISFAFFLLGLGFTALGRFFNDHQMLFTRIGGIIIILFGLFQLGIFGDSSLRKEHRIHFQPDTLVMNPFTALLCGFTFSFAWTPCVGPALASVLIMTATASTSFTGFWLIALYTLGFVLPFMAVGIFTGTLLNLFKKYRAIVKYTVKIGGILMILIGIMMFTGWMNGISTYLSGASLSHREDVEEPNDDTASAPDTFPAPDFTLIDQYGNTHTLSDYKGKTVFLNFWATWCPPCRAEMPEIQEIYEEYGKNNSDVIVLGIASPNSGSEGSAEDIAAFLEDNGYSYPVVMDTEGLTAYYYGISAYPTTFMIDKEGDLFSYVTGQLTKDIMRDIIEQTMNH